MSIQDLEAEVERLSPSELTIFSKWFAKFAATFCRGSRTRGMGCFSSEGLAPAYSESEPEYTLADVKWQ